MKRLLLIVCALAWAGCSSDDDGGTGGAAGTSGSSGTGGGTGVDIHCEASSATDCVCTQDVSGSFDPSESAECSKASLGPAICCHPIGYPESGSCDCKQVGCFESDSTCRCGTTEAGQTLTECQNTWQFCCETVVDNAIESCTCSNVDTGCNGPNEQVATTCSVALLSCGAGEVPTEDCKNP